MDIVAFMTAAVAAGWGPPGIALVSFVTVTAWHFKDIIREWRGASNDRLRIENEHKVVMKARETALVQKQVELAKIEAERVQNTPLITDQRRNNLPAPPGEA